MIPMINLIDSVNQKKFITMRQKMKFLLLLALVLFAVDGFAQDIHERRKSPVQKTEVKQAATKSNVSPRHAKIAKAEVEPYAWMKATNGNKMQYPVEKYNLLTPSQQNEMKQAAASKGLELEVVVTNAKKTKTLANKTKRMMKKDDIPVLTKSTHPRNADGTAKAIQLSGQRQMIGIPMPSNKK